MQGRSVNLRHLRLVALHCFEVWWSYKSSPSAPSLISKRRAKPSMSVLGLRFQRISVLDVRNAETRTFIGNSARTDYQLRFVIRHYVLM